LVKRNRNDESRERIALGPKGFRSCVLLYTDVDWRRRQGLSRQMHALERDRETLVGRRLQQSDVHRLHRQAIRIRGRVEYEKSTYSRKV